MRAKDQLQRVRDLKFRIKSLEEERDNVRLLMISVKSTSDYSDRVQSSPRPDGLENTVIRITEQLEELDKEYLSKIEQYSKERDSVKANINKMKDGQYKTFLIDYYIHGESWDWIIKQYHYASANSAYHIDQRAVNAYEKAIHASE